MSIEAAHALWFLPFVLPICLYVAFTDMAQMRITNQAVVLLALVFLVLGAFLFPLTGYLWRVGTIVIVLVVGIILNAAGAMGAGDAKFLAAASPYVALGDLRTVMILLMVTLLAAAIAHRTAKHTPLRRMAPHWTSWEQGKKFPMGLALGPALALYLILGALYGAR